MYDNCSPPTSCLIIWGPHATSHSDDTEDKGIIYVWFLMLVPIPDHNWSGLCSPWKHCSTARHPAQVASQKAPACYPQMPRRSPCKVTHNSAWVVLMSKSGTSIVSDMCDITIVSHRLSADSEFVCTSVSACSSTNWYLSWSERTQPTFAKGGLQQLQQPGLYCHYTIWIRS